MLGVQICTTYSKHYIDGSGLSLEGLCQVRRAHTFVSTKCLPLLIRTTSSDGPAPCDVVLRSFTRKTATRWAETTLSCSPAIRPAQVSMQQWHVALGR